MPQVESPAQPPRQTLENHSPSPSQTRRVQAPGLIQKQGLFRYPRFKRLSKPLECSQPIEFTPAWPSSQSSRTHYNCPPPRAIKSSSALKQRFEVPIKASRSRRRISTSPLN